MSWRRKPLYRLTGYRLSSEEAKERTEADTLEKCHLLASSVGSCIHPELPVQGWLYLQGAEPFHVTH